MAEADIAAQVDRLTTTPPLPVTDGCTSSPLLAPSSAPESSDPAPRLLPTPPAAANKKSAYRPQKEAAVATVAEHILEAVAATKERQAPPAAWAARRKTTSAAGYELDGGRPNNGRSSPLRAAAPSAQRPGGGKEEQSPKRGRPTKLTPKRARGAHQNLKGPKNLKTSSFRARKKVPKRPLASRPLGRKLVAGKRR